MEKILDSIKSPADIKKLSYNELDILAEEIRQKLVSTVSKTGGHLSSNLGTVELTIALHKVFDCPYDEFVWDVGHQSYTHKILTGRLDCFDSLRQKDGISGFPKHNESKYDAFVAGHASTSVSAAYGIAQAKKLSGDDGYSVAIVGDGAFTGGLIYEGLNNSGRSDTRLIVILNDNEMSISKNVGGLSKYFSEIRSRRSYFAFKDGLRKFLQKLPLVGKPIEQTLIKIKKMFKATLYKSTFFEDLGFVYLGPIDGHDIKKTVEILQRAKQLNEPVLIHLNTIKGKGYNFAEKYPSDFHGVSKFDVDTGDMPQKSDNFTNHFSDALMKIADKNDKICAITAAMKDSTGLLEFSKKYPERFFDVGIAEAHAVTFSAALAQNSYIPILAIYSTFLQRAYDQIIHDVAIEKQHVVFAVDRAGIVGDDGETHQGVFDVAFLTHIPGMTVFSPSNYDEITTCLEKAVFECDGPVAVRYPRGSETKIETNTKSFGDWEVLENKDAKIAVVTYGRIFSETVKAVSKLSEKGIDVTAVKLIKICPIDNDVVKYLSGFDKIYFFEEGIEKGSVAYTLNKMLTDINYNGKFNVTAIDGKFVAQSSVKQALKELDLDCDGITAVITHSEGICTNA